MALAITSCLPFTSCESEDKNPCGVTYGGFGMVLNTYVFWMDANYGQLTVEVKDAKGQIQQPDNSTISVYYLGGGPVQDCSASSRQNNAVYQLAPGETYTYRAYNIERSFTGTIDLTCEQSCSYIRIGVEN